MANARTSARQTMRGVQDLSNYEPATESYSNETEEGTDDWDSDEFLGEGVDIALEPSVYYAGIFSLIHDGIEIITKKDHDKMALKLNVARVFFVVVSLLFNYALQIGLIFWIYRFVVAPSVRDVQVIYRQYHAEVFDSSGSYNHEKWVEWDEDQKAHICGLVFSNWRFLYLMLSLWWMAMLNEFRKTDRLRRNLSDMSSTRRAEAMVEEPDEDGTTRIMRLLPSVRWTLYMLLVMPKYLINIALLILGTTWLTSTQGGQDLIMNCIALGFVIEIDELIFEAMFPARMAEQMEQVKIFKTEERTMEAEQREMKNGYLRSAGYWLAIIFGTFLYIKYGQVIPYVGVLPGYSSLNPDSCKVWWADSTSPVCDPWGAWNGVPCFPYGKGDSGEASAEE